MSGCCNFPVCMCRPKHWQVERQTPCTRHLPVLERSMQVTVACDSACKNDSEAVENDVDEMTEDFGTNHTVTPALPQGIAGACHAIDM